MTDYLHQQALEVAKRVVEEKPNELLLLARAYRSVLSQLDRIVRSLHDAEDRNNAQAESIAELQRQVKELRAKEDSFERGLVYEKIQQLRSERNYLRQRVKEKDAQILQLRSRGY